MGSKETQYNNQTGDSKTSKNFEYFNFEEIPGIEPKYPFSFIMQMVLAIIVVVVTLPIQVIVALFILLGSGFPIIYRGPRVGLNNTIFKLQKFRTLPDKYEYTVGSRLLTDKERNRSLLAKIIVRIKLDELPQLYNVITGDMAIVGPRPVRPALYARYKKEISGYSHKLHVRPGITGLAQIVGGYYMDPVDKHYYDILYVKNKSFILDIKIIILTFLALIFSRRIMQSSTVQKFLGLNLNVESTHIDPTSDVVDKVTSCEDQEPEEPVIKSNQETVHQKRESAI